MYDVTVSGEVSRGGGDGGGRSGPLPSKPRWGHLSDLPGLIDLRSKLKLTDTEVLNAAA